MFKNLIHINHRLPRGIIYLGSFHILILAIFLLVGGVIGAQYGSKYTSKFKGEQIRIFLALIVIIVCIKMGIELINEPLMNSRIIIQDAY